MAARGTRAAGGAASDRLSQRLSIEYDLGGTIWGGGHFTGEGPDLLANVSIRTRVEEILAAGAERAEITVEQVLRELAMLGFSDIGKVVRWRPELVYEETS